MGMRFTERTQRSQKSKRNVLILVGGTILVFALLGSYLALGNIEVLHTGQGLQCVDQYGNIGDCVNDSTIMLTQEFACAKIVEDRTSISADYEIFYDNATGIGTADSTDMQGC